jgi:predicted  nucleic acid-binding Zn-ribbon protein
MLTDRCFFQVYLPNSREAVKLKLAPDCPLIHLFQHPKLQLPASLEGLTFSQRNIPNLDPDRTPEYYGMGTGENDVNDIHVRSSNSTAPPPPTTTNNNIKFISSPPQPTQFTSINQNQGGGFAAVNSPTSSFVAQQLQQQENSSRRHRQEVELLTREAKNTIDSLENRIRAQQQTISSLQQQNRKLEKEVQRAEEKMATSSNKQEKAAFETDNLVRELSQLQFQIARAEGTASENKKFKSKFETLEKSHFALQQDFASLQEVCRGYRDQLDKRMAEQSELRTDLDSLQRENEKLMSECALGSQYAIRLASQEERNRERRDANRSLILDLQNQQNVLSEQLSATRAALEREVNTSAEYRANLEMAVKDLKEARTAAIYAEKQLEQETAARRAIEIEVDRKKRRRREDRETFMKEIGELEFSLKASERKVTALEEQLRIATSKVVSPTATSGLKTLQQINQQQPLFAPPLLTPPETPPYAPSLTSSIVPINNNNYQENSSPVKRFQSNDVYPATPKSALKNNNSSFATSSAQKRVLEF